MGRFRSCTPTGLSLTLALGYSDELSADARYGYVKIGYQTDIFEVGKTAFSVDAYYGEDIAAVKSNSTSFGAQLVQNLDYLQTELILALARMTTIRRTRSSTTLSQCSQGHG